MATFGFGLAHLGERSIWEDEGASISIASQHGLALWRAIAHDGGNFFAYYLILHVVIRCFGSGTDVLRLPSVLFSAVTVPITFALARRIATRRAALFSCALVGLSSSAIYWGQMVRGYTLAAALAAGASYAFVLALERGHTRDLVVYGLCCVALCYTLLLGALVVVAHLVAFSVRRDSRISLRQLATTLGGVAVGCVPLLVIAVSRGAGQLFWLPPPRRSDLRNAANFLASSATSRPNAYSAPLTEITFGLIVIGLAYALIALRPSSRGSKAFGLVLAGAWLLLPPLFSLAVSETVQPIFVSRYFLLDLPAVAILLAMVLARVKPFALSAALLVGLLALRVTEILPSYGHSIDDYRFATTAVLQKSRPGDCIVFYAQDVRVDFAYYVDQRDAETIAHEGPVPRSILPAIAWNANPAIVEQYATLSSAELTSDSQSCTRVWVIASHAGHPNGTAAAEADFHRFEVLRAAIRAAYPVRAVHIVTPVSVTCYARADREVA